MEHEPKRRGFTLLSPYCLLMEWFFLSHSGSCFHTSPSLLKRCWKKNSVRLHWILSTERQNRWRSAQTSHRANVPLFVLRACQLIGYCCFFFLRCVDFPSYMIITRTTQVVRMLVAYTRGIFVCVCLLYVISSAQSYIDAIKEIIRTRVVHTKNL